MWHYVSACFRVASALFIVAALSSCSDSLKPESEDASVSMRFKAVFYDAEVHHSSWTDNDAVSFFSRSGNAERYIFRTVSNSFVRFSTYTDPEYATYYVIAPYCRDFNSHSDGVFNVELPSVQQWSEDGPDPQSNIIVGAASDLLSTSVQMHAAVGYLRVPIASSTSMKSVSLKGNNGEILAGSCSVEAGYKAIPKLTLRDTVRSVTVQFPEGGKTGSSDVVFCLPPVTFEKGVTITVNTGEGEQVITYNPAFAIQRSKMTDISGLGTGKTFTAFGLRDSAGQLYKAVDALGSSIVVCVPRGVDQCRLTPVFTHSGSVVSCEGEAVESDRSVIDFSNSVKFTVTSASGECGEYNVNVVDYDIPVVHVSTPKHAPIASKEIWVTDSKFVIQNLDGSLTDYGLMSVKGRGNASWKREKKSYSVKLSTKPKELGVLGLPGHKRWCLIAVQWGYLGNNVGYELARRAASYKWQPSGRYVELVLNGKHVGTYFLAEQIRVDKKRVNIRKGGYLLTFDRTFNDPNRFKSRYYNMPVMIKDPDEDELTQEQFSYIEDYINNFEASLADNTRFAAREWEQYFDIDTYIDMWFVWEMAGKTGSHSGADFAHPNSVWFYKDVDGKLTAGPCWDFDSYLFTNQNLLCNNCQYYGRLFKDPVFKARVKEKWPVFRAAVEKGIRPSGSTAWKSSLPISEFIDSCRNEVSYSAARNQKMWTWTMYQLDTEYQTIHDGLPAKLEWLEKQIEEM